MNKVIKEFFYGVVAAMKIDDLRTRNSEEPPFHYNEDSRSIDPPGGRSAGSFFMWLVGDFGINSYFSLFLFSDTRN